MNSAIKNHKNKGGGQPHRRKLDSTDIQIIDELLANADVSSSEIASKLNIPLSTIQRRRTVLDSMSILNHRYKINPLSFGLRAVEFWVLIERGKADEIAKCIFDKFDNVLRATVQMNAISNVGVLAYFNNSKEVYTMLEEIKAMRYVNHVDFAELIKVVGTRQVNFFKRMNQA